MAWLYKVSSAGDFGDAESMCRWTTRKSEIPALKREIQQANHDWDAHPVPSVERIELTPTVRGVLELLNKHATRG